MLQKNTHALFGEIDQSDDKNQLRSCTIMASENAIKYNNGLPVSEIDANRVIQKQIKNGQLSIKTGAKAIDSFNAVKIDIKENYKKDLKWITFKSLDIKKLEELLNLGYMVTIAIKVNQHFIDDCKDGKLNETNYFKYTTGKTFGHLTNIFRWKGRFTVGCEKLPDYDKDFVYDSYAFNKRNRAWIYSNIDLKQLKIISQNNFYCFYI